MDQSCQLTSQALYRVCEHSQLTFETTQELETYKGFFGQHRALEAMEFGVGMIRPGYNLFVMGNPHTGRFSFAMESLRTSAQTADSPSDWVYLNNLDDRRYPKALPFPPGRADAFRKGVNSLLESILTELPAAFENPSYQRQKGKIEWEFNRQYEKAIEKVERQAREYSIAVYRDGGNVGFTPVKDGQAMDEAAFSQLTEEAREAFSNAIAELEELLNDALTELPYGLRGFIPVGHPGGISEVHQGFGWQRAGKGMGNGQSPDAGIKNANGPGIARHYIPCNLAFTCAEMSRSSGAYSRLPPTTSNT